MCIPLFSDHQTEHYIYCQIDYCFLRADEKLVCSICR